MDGFGRIEGCDGVSGLACFGFQAFGQRLGGDKRTIPDAMSHIYHHPASPLPKLLSSSVASWVYLNGL